MALHATDCKLKCSGFFCYFRVSTALKTFFRTSCVREVKHEEDLEIGSAESTELRTKPNKGRGHKTKKKSRPKLFLSIFNMTFAFSRWLPLLGAVLQLLVDVRLLLLFRHAQCPAGPVPGGE